jgi:hypothetical protein
MIRVTLFLLLISISAVSQVHTTVLEGRVTDNDRHLEGVHVLNVTTGLGAVSNDLGLFEIGVRVDDTLLFSSLQHHNRRIVIDQQLIRDGFIVVYLQDKVTELDAVMLHGLTGSVTADLQQVPKARPERFEFEWKPEDLARTFEADRIDKSKAPIAGGVPNMMTSGAGASATIPLFGLEAEYALRRRLQEKVEFREFLLRKFGRKYFTEQLNISTPRLYEFLDFCETETTLDHFRNNRILQLIEICKERSVKFHEQKND